MKTLILSIAIITAMTTIAFGQDAKAHLRDFTPKYTIDTLQLNGEASYLKRRVILFQKAEGVRSAYWDDDSNILTVQYDDKLVQLSAIKNFFLKNQSFSVLQQEQRQRINPVFVYLINPYSKTSKR